MMREVVPYRTVRGATQALDNGGRFFNLFATADDHVLSAAELAKAAGVFSSGTRAFLFFEMALMELPASDQAEVTALLSSDLQARYESQRPTIMAPSAVEVQGQAGLPAIVSGYPVFVEDKTQFQGFIFTTVPMVMLIPIIDVFDVYEVFDTPDRRTPRTVIATARGSRRLDGVFSRFGGILKQLHFEDKTDKEHGLYLETLYYTPLS
jgi:hypothetical protein